VEDVWKECCRHAGKSVAGGIRKTSLEHRIALAWAWMQRNTDYAQNAVDEAS
jgi:hypothetical protein